MPRSKKAKQVSLTRTNKKTKESKGAQIEAIKEHADKWKYVWIFSVGNMRNSALKDVRHAWKGTGRLFFGRSRVMAKALGSTPEEECKPGIHVVAEKLHGPVGLFFTDSQPEEVIEWFKWFEKPDFARAGNRAAKDVILPEGPITMYNDSESTFPASMDPQLRKLGLTTTLVRGAPTLQVSHAVCKQGDKLTAEQAQLLKLIGEQMSVFRVRLVGHWSEDEQWVDVEGLPVGEEEDVPEEGDTSMDDE